MASRSFRLGAVLLFGALLAVLATVGAVGFLRSGRESNFESADYSRYIEISKTPVVLFSTSVCPFCEKTRAYLDVRKIPYRDFVIDKDERAMAIFNGIDGIGVPVVLTARHKLVGFHSENLAKLLAMDGISAKTH